MEAFLQKIFVNITSDLVMYIMFRVLKSYNEKKYSSAASSIYFLPAKGNRQCATTGCIKKIDNVKWKISMFPNCVSNCFLASYRFWYENTSFNKVVHNILSRKKSLTSRNYLVVYRRKENYSHIDRDYRNFQLCAWRMETRKDWRYLRSGKEQV